MSSKLAVGDPAYVFSAPESGTTYLGEVYTLSVTLSSLPVATTATSYVQFMVDKEGSAHDPKGFRAVDGGDGKVMITGTDIGKKTLTVSIQIYADAAVNRTITYEASYNPGSPGAASVPIINTPQTTIMGAISNFTAENAIVLTNPGVVKPSPVDALQNFFHIKLGVQTYADDTPIKKGVYVANLSLKDPQSKEGVDSYVKGALNKLQIFTDRAGTKLTVNTSGVGAGDYQLVTSNPNAEFEFFICGGAQELAGHVHLDLVGQDETAGTLIVTQLASPDPAIGAPLLDTNLVDVASTAMVRGTIPNTGGISFGSTIYVVLSNKNVATGAKQLTLLTQIDSSNAYTWQYGQNGFTVPTEALTQPAVPGAPSDGLQNHISYVVLTGGGQMDMSSSSLLKAWRSTQNVPVITTPPPFNPLIEAPSFPDVNPAHPDEVSNTMCRNGLKVLLDWTNSPADQQYVTDEFINVDLVMNGWDANTTLPRTGTARQTRAVTPAEAAAKQMIMQFTPEQTAGFRDKEQGGALGKIMATYWKGTGQASLQTPEFTSKSITDKFYSTGIGS